MNRAYSLLHIKAIDEDKRVISGMATTPAPDRVGDIVEPLGVTFKNPLPFLLYHDSKQPVGTVRFHKPTAEGISFEATIASIDEPASLKERVDTAWASVKAGLLKGVSIGFRAIEEAYNKDTGGWRFLKTEVLELSLVAVPANQDCTIATIKSLDIGLAATGTEAAVAPVNQPGASGTVRVVKAMRQDSKMKTYTEQIASFEATRQAKAADRNAIMQKAADDGVTLDAAQKEAYDALDREVKEIDEHLGRLKALELETRSAAKPVDGSSAAAAGASRISVIQVKDNTPPGIGFARAIMCKMQSFKEYRNVVEIAKERYPHDDRVQAYLKTAVTAAGTADATYMGALVDPTNLASEFIEYLRPQTIIGRIPNLRRVPFNVRVIGQTTGGAGYWVGQGAAKPLTKFGVAPTTLTWAKVAAISVITEELARFSSPSAEALVRDQLAAALIERIDIDFVDPDKAAVSGVSPASITNGITPIVSSGTEASSVRTDLQALFAAIIEDNLNPNDFVFIMPNATAMSLALMTNGLGQPEFNGITMNGGTLMGIPVVTSQYVTDGSPGGAIIILANAREIFLSDDGQVTVDVSREASLNMDDAPTNNSITPTATSLVSMFQTNSIALRAERFINWARRRTQAVQYLSSVSYSATGSPS